MKVRHFSRKSIRALGTTLAISLLVAGYYATRERISFQGRSIEYWFRELSFETSRGPTAPRRALRSMGPDAVPFLLKKFERQNSRLSQQLRKHLVRVESLLPARVIHLLESPELDSTRARIGFSYLGVEARAAVPTLAQYLTSPLKGSNATFALGAIGPPAFPVLLL